MLHITPLARPVMSEYLHVISKRGACPEADLAACRNGGSRQDPTHLLTSAAQRFSLGAPPRGVVLFLEGDQITDDALKEDLGCLLDPQHHLETMQAKWPDFWVGVLLPNRVTPDGFSAYDHCLTGTTLTGEPFGYNGAALKASSHLAEVLATASRECPGLEGVVPLLGLPCHLIGFSKAGVVLNQLLAEMAVREESNAHQHQMEVRESQSAGVSPAAVHTSATSGGPPQAASTSIPAPVPHSAMKFLDSVAEVHYLDAGLNGRGVHLTDPRLVDSLALRNTRQLSSGVRPLVVNFHGTPRQWRDKRRPWICQEKDRSVSLLSKAGVAVSEKMYFAGQPPSLMQHFEIISALRR